MKKSNQLVALTMIMFLFSTIWLSYISKKQMDPNYQKNWWVLSFVDPKDSSLNFSIENHSNGEKFHWQAASDKTIAKEGDVTIKKGATLTIPVSPIAQTENKRIIITVSDSENKKKEIYKSL